MSAQIVILAPNWLGDAVMALPAIRDVRAASSGATIGVAARPSVAPLFRLVDGIDRVVTIEKSSKLGRFDAALLLPNSFHAALMAFGAGIPERWGYRADCRSPLLTRAVAKPPRGHQIDYYQHLTEALGFPRGESRPHLDVSPAARQRGRRPAGTGAIRSSPSRRARRTAARSAGRPSTSPASPRRWPPTASS